jgi:hypothetical protein
MRLNGLRWAAVEPAPGERNWDAVADLEADLRANYAAGIETILIVRDTPAWAQKLPGYSCGPASPDALDDMAQFLSDAVTRYSEPPFGVSYWEMGNEPDVDPSLVAPDAAYGCWGDLDATYYGGEYYGKMLQAVYPAIKAVDPEAQVLIGGLLLDREPAKDGLPNPPGRFLEGILQSKGGDYFDIVSFHAYLYWDPSRTDWEMGYEVWLDRGGIIVGKADYLREVLAENGYDKPLMLTEAGLLCHECAYPPPSDFLQAAGAYVPRMFIRNMELGFLATIWYTLDGPGWQQAGLLDAEQTPRPAYDALKTMTTFLQDSRYAGRVDGLRGLGGYLFEKPGGELRVVWSLDATPIALPVPPGLQAAYDHYGAPLETAGETLEIGFNPVYLLIQNP